LCSTTKAPALPQTVPACRIDAQVVRWAEYLPFVEAGGYTQPRWWDDDGAHWLRQSQALAPRYCAAKAAHWQQCSGGRWRPLQAEQAASHLTLHEARAWCRWAGRRLPTEAEWERAACTAPDAFRLGRRVGMDGQPVCAVPRLRSTPLPRLFGALVRRPPGAESGRRT
jgi:iron(II)-dependent oxidoreductase